MITIDGNSIPTPSDYQLSLIDLTKADRTASGSTIIEKIATKRKIDISWDYLSNASLSALITAVSTNTFFAVVYPDIYTGASRSSTFFCADKSAGMIDYQSGIPRWKNIKLTLQEK